MFSYLGDAERPKNMQGREECQLNPTCRPDSQRYPFTFGLSREDIAGFNLLKNKNNSIEVFAQKSGIFFKIGRY